MLLSSVNPPFEPTTASRRTDICSAALSTNLLRHHARQIALTWLHAVAISLTIAASKIQNFPYSANQKYNILSVTNQIIIRDFQG
ncbi:MAG: hypothetical protein KDE31_34435 [Caldilineaceae bacterium]|nr:hypothetical protein [Caldilineaceae bacterium]